MENGHKDSIVEAIILASAEPVRGRRIADLIEGITPRQVHGIVARLNNRYMESGCSFRIRELAGGYQFVILPEFTGYAQELFARRRKLRLTRAALETLAIVAYRQPVTKSEIENIRGVACDGVIHNLLEKQMITIKGRANTVGRPLQYGSTDEFLKFFGLAGLDDLPEMSEIEELIRDITPESPAQLSLDPTALNAQLQRKLNVADGTFDPRSREENGDFEDAPVESNPLPEVESVPRDDGPDDETVIDDDSVVGDPVKANDHVADNEVTADPQQ